MESLLIIGAGQHGAVVREIAEIMRRFDRIDFLDDNSPLAIGKISDAEKLRVTYQYAFVSIGDNAVRHEIIGKFLALSYKLPVIQHPNAIVSPSAKLGRNVLLCANSVVDTETTISDGTFLSIGALVGHHCTVGECCHIAVGTVVPNNSNVPARTKIQAGQTFLK